MKLNLHFFFFFLQNWTKWFRKSYERPKNRRCQKTHWSCKYSTHINNVLLNFQEI